MRRLVNSKKANYAPVLTIGYVFFCIVWYIIMTAFASDPLYDGTPGQMDNFEGVDINESEDSTYVSYSDRSFISKFFIVVFNMPWWMTLLTITFQSVFLGVIILAWIRGL